MLTQIAANLIVHSLPSLIARVNTKIGDTHSHVAVCVVEKTHANAATFKLVRASIPKLLIVSALSTLAILPWLTVECASASTINADTLTCIIGTYLQTKGTR